MWWVLFTDPEHCDGACDEGDSLDPEAGVSILFATGGVVGRNGIANFRAHYTEGDDLGEPFGIQCFDPQAVAHLP